MFPILEASTQYSDAGAVAMAFFSFFIITLAPAIPFILGILLFLFLYKMVKQ